MSHAICYRDYPVSTPEVDIQALCDDEAREKSDSHQSLLRKVVFCEQPICNSKVEAQEYLRSIQKDRYDQLAVRYREAPKNNSAISAAHETAGKARTAYGELEKAPHFTGAKSKFVTCKECGSSINVTYIDGSRAFTRANYCPVCHAET